MTDKERLTRVTESIVGAVIEVHRALKPGRHLLTAETQRTRVESSLQDSSANCASPRWIRDTVNMYPGLVESADEVGLASDLVDRGVKVEQQKLLPVVYREVRPDCGYRLDLLTVGLLIGLNVKVLKDGIRPRGDGFPDSLRSRR